MDSHPLIRTTSEKSRDMVLLLRPIGWMALARVSHQRPMLSCRQRQILNIGENWGKLAQPRSPSKSGVGVENCLLFTESDCCPASHLPLDLRCNFPSDLPSPNLSIGTEFSAKVPWNFTLNHLNATARSFHIQLKYTSSSSRELAICLSYGSLHRSLRVRRIVVERLYF